MPTPSTARQPALRASMTPRQALRSVMLESLRHLSSNVPGILSCDDPEYVHQARVALRRLRAAGKAFAPLTSGADWEPVMAQAQRLAAALGRLRDLDVLLLQILPEAEQASARCLRLSALRRALRQRREQARSAVRASLSSPDHMAWCGALLGLLNQPPGTDEQEKQPGFARKSLRRSWKTVRRLARRWHTLDAEQRHDLRKRAKKLRYSVEFFSALYRRKSVKQYLKPLQEVQQLLGTINDRAAAQSLLEQCAQDAPALRGEANQLCNVLMQQDPPAASEVQKALRRLRQAGAFWK
ncbi:hypothetical protein C2134_13655 [Chromobacterium sinusclupearum]|uniref:CHAD domain-containing protein n=1 Tax=Chromobacterium sinusclupearum TaxID=2077146 RepID=A0A2K4MLU9_9NEIS|nr:CHAD domain-containing protein [Chromobacterium sinusclupearum]POA98063.1 hypothetical protein C2134_13655 [Chromobacterium sinusclupearum]